MKTYNVIFQLFSSYRMILASVAQIRFIIFAGIRQTKTESIT